MALWLYLVNHVNLLFYRETNLANSLQRVETVFNFIFLFEAIYQKLLCVNHIVRAVYDHCLIGNFSKLVVFKNLPIHCKLLPVKHFLKNSLNLFLYLHVLIQFQVVEPPSFEDIIEWNDCWKKKTDIARETDIAENRITGINQSRQEMILGHSQHLHLERGPKAVS